MAPCFAVFKYKGISVLLFSLLLCRSNLKRKFLDGALSKDGYDLAEYPFPKFQRFSAPKMLIYSLQLHYKHVPIASYNDILGLKLYDIGNATVFVKVF